MKGIMMCSRGRYNTSAQPEAGISVHRDRASDSESDSDRDWHSTVTDFNVHVTRHDMTRTHHGGRRPRWRVAVLVIDFKVRLFRLRLGVSA
jgi:hypothetical protein